MKTAVNFSLILAMGLFSFAQALPVGEHWFVQPTGGARHTLLVTGALIGGNPLQNGDEIGLLNQNSLCAGHHVVSGNPP